MMVTAHIAGASTAALTAPEATTAGGPVTGITLKGPRHVMAHRAVTLRGQVAPAGNRSVVVEVAGQELHARTSDDGRYRVRWNAPGAGVYRARAGAAGDTAVHSHPARVNVYRPAAASYYGPGLYGGGLACGGTLTPGKMGVANRTLPCGTKVTLRYRGHTVTVPVVDRGPFSGNREFDLTAATKAKLGFPSTGTVLTTR
jgi:peptidoglycan lytic transglycosylase